MNNRPVFVLDDDGEELDIVKEIWQELDCTHPLEVFGSTEKFLQRMSEKNVNPFLIISEVNLDTMDGFTLRQKLCSDVEMSYKSIPFVFWSTAASNEQIKVAYDSGGHGFFLKGYTYQEIKKSLSIIMTYWSKSEAPVLPNQRRDMKQIRKST